MIPIPESYSELGRENKIVRVLQKSFGGRSASIIKGIGDDAAVIHPRGASEYWAFTADMLLEDVDFRNGWLTPGQLGHKSLAANLSDLAAMGVRPRFYALCLGIPETVPEQWIIAFYKGLTKLASAHGAMLIGGDLSRSAQGIQITIAAIGETQRRQVVYRSGGKAGDSLYVTGVLGMSAAGLNLLEQGCLRGTTIPERRALKAHRTPLPRCEAGLWLSQSHCVSCMMDLSDGISADLPRLCEASRVGAEIYISSMPIFSASKTWGFDPLSLALHGGEDFELLFAVPRRKTAIFEKTYPRDFPQAVRIGMLTRSRGVVWRQSPGKPAHPLPTHGFDHFRS
jgi:thiamine-monophosphate kinase